MPYNESAASLTVHLGNQPNDKRASAKMVVFHSSYHQHFSILAGAGALPNLDKITWDQRRARDHDSIGRESGIDVALIFLAEDLPVVNTPAGLQCSIDASGVPNQLPDSYDMISGFTAGAARKTSGTFPTIEGFKTLTYDLYPFSPGQLVTLVYAAVERTPSGGTKKHWMYTEPGDSGSALMTPESNPGDPSGREIHGVHVARQRNKLEPGDVPGDPPFIMEATAVAPICEWINTVRADLYSAASFDERVDVILNDAGKVEGTFKHYIARLSNEGVDLQIAAGEDVADYEIRLETPPSEMRAAQVATFSDSGAGFVFLDRGEIIARNVFDEGPISITGGTEEYVDLIVANTKSPTQPYNDLVAIRAGVVGAHLFEGGPVGLERADVDGIAITRVDDDMAADVVVVSGSSIRVVTPVSVASTSLAFAPVRSASGRFTRNAHNSGMDLVFLGSANQVAWCPMTSEGTFRDGGCEGLSMPDGLSPIGIRATYFNADEYEDLEVPFNDGKVGIFAGSSTNLTFLSFLQGLPSARTDDGKTLLLSGTDSDTLGVPVAEFYVSEPVDSENVPTGEPLMIQLYDVGINHSYDSLPPESNLSTCVNLYASPIPGASEEVLVRAVGETEIGSATGDLAWFTLFDSNTHSPAAESASGVHWYRVEMKLVNVDDECNAAPVVDHAGFNGFKLRSTGQLRSPNAMALYAADIAGDFSSFESAPDTDFDGIFNIPFQVGGAVERPEIPGATPLNISLRQADADDADLDSDADGQREDVFFELFSGTVEDGIALQVQRTEGQQEDDFNIPGDRVEDPSGNSSGDGAGAVFEKHTTEGITGQTVLPGLHTWHWQNVGAENAIQLQPITGSPINHEYIASGGRWVSSSANATPSALLALDDAALESLLPLDVGNPGFGYLRSFSSSEAVREGLSLDSEDLNSLLLRELLALKVNRRRSEQRGDPLGAAFILSTRLSVADLIEQVDAMLGGSSVDLKPEEALQLMATANAGQVTHLSPREIVLSSEDRDSDGIVDARDNCVMRANGEQLDSNGDGIGDRCEPAPTVWCVEPRESGGAVAVFGYESPLRDFRVGAGARNEISGEGVDVEPPVLFRRGGLRQAVSVPFYGESVTWLVLGNSATATLDSPACSEIGPGSAVCEAPTSEFHCCTSIADCQVAGKFRLYATDTIRLGARVRVRDAQARPGSILSLGSIVMDAEAEAGDVMGGGELVVGDRVALFGDIAVAGNVTELGQPTSFRVRHVPLDAPDLSAFARSFESVGTAHPSVQRGGQLDPGHYGATDVVEGVTTLVTGEYYFTSLDVADDAVLTINGSSGPVIVHIAGSLALFGVVNALPGELLVELHGSGEALVSTDLAATIIAPDGRIVVDQPGSVQNGAYYARNIEIASDVTLLHHEPLAPRR